MKCGRKHHPTLHPSRNDRLPGRPQKPCRDRTKSSKEHKPQDALVQDVTATPTGIAQDFDRLPGLERNKGGGSYLRQEGIPVSKELRKKDAQRGPRQERSHQKL